jgi:hypothetical protein
VEIVTFKIFYFNEMGLSEALENGNGDGNEMGMEMEMEMGWGGEEKTVAKQQSKLLRTPFYSWDRILSYRCFEGFTEGTSTTTLL